eukprot:tig00001177_g7361.t2
MRNAPPIDNALGGGKPLHVNRSPTAASPASFPAGIVVLASRSNCCRAAPLAPHRGHARDLNPAEDGSAQITETRHGAETEPRGSARAHVPLSVRELTYDSAREAMSSPRHLRCTVHARRRPEDFVFGRISLWLFDSELP